ncbi:MAG: DEAD/DEAH box helicase, partial [Planctomycetota bacterium]|nr:DEAD/DEAH box helicase [Planctomycetota bacterium]
SDVERGLEELVASGLVTSDSFASLRQFLRPARGRRGEVIVPGRWSRFRADPPAPPEAQFVVERLLARYGVIFRALLLRERQPIPWRDLVRACRTLELRGDLRGGRFVAGFSGEQYALPEAIPFLRKIRKRAAHAAFSISAADPLNLAGILTPDDRVPSTSTADVALVS